MVIGHKAAGKLLVKEDVLGIIYAHSEGCHLMQDNDQNHAQNQKPVFILHDGEDRVLKGDLLLRLLHLGHRLPGAEIHKHADHKRNRGKDRRHQNPAPLSAAQGVHNVQAEHGEDHLHQTGEDHADGIGRCAAGRVVGHVNRQGVDGTVEDGEGDGHGEVIGHDYRDLTNSECQRSAVRHGKEQYIGRRHQNRAAQDPGPGRAAFGVGMVDQVPCPKVADTVENFADQNNQAHKSDLHSQHIGIEEGQERQGNGVDRV